MAHFEQSLAKLLGGRGGVLAADDDNTGGGAEAPSAAELARTLARAAKIGPISSV